jgi:protein-tyrosine phosphatase
LQPRGLSTFGAAPQQVPVKLTIMKKVLFLCTGNYYRSRFAEGLFNHLAKQFGLDWRADSCALALERGENVNPGPVSRYALEGFQVRGISLPQPIRYPKRATLQDFATSDLVVALKEDEHRPLMRERFPEWENRITYWHIHDLDLVPHHQALPEIETLVQELIANLAQSRVRPAESV